MINKIKRCICNYCKPNSLLDVKDINEENAKSIFYNILMDRNSKDNLHNKKIIQEILQKWYCDINWLKKIREELTDYIINFENLVGYFEIDKNDLDEIILNLDLLSSREIHSLLFEDESISKLKIHFKDIIDNNNENFAIILCERLIKRFQKDDLKDYQDNIKLVYENIFFDKLNKDWRLKILFLKFIKEENFDNLPNPILNSFFQRNTEIINKALAKHRKNFKKMFLSVDDKDFELYYKNVNKYHFKDIDIIISYITNKEFLILLKKIKLDVYNYNIQKIIDFLNNYEDEYPRLYLELLKNHSKENNDFKEILIEFFDSSKEDDIYVLEKISSCIANEKNLKEVRLKELFEATKYVKLSEGHKEILTKNNIAISDEVNKFDNKKLLDFIEKKEEPTIIPEVENIIKELNTCISKTDEDIIEIFSKKLKKLKESLAT